MARIETNHYLDATNFLAIAKGFHEIAQFNKGIRCFKLFFDAHHNQKTLLITFDDDSQACLLPFYMPFNQEGVVQ